MNEKLNDDVNENPDSGPEYESSSPGDPEELDLDKEHFDEVVREKEQFRAIAQRAQADLVALFLSSCLLYTSDAADE